MVVFFSISLVITPPSVSMPSDSGVTSSSSTSLTLAPSTPPWIAAPTATASSGFTSLRGSLPKNSLTFSCTLRHARHAADQDHVVDVAGLHAGVLERDAAGLDRALDQVLDQRLELGARELDVQVLRARGVGRDVGQVDVGLLCSLDSSILAFSAASFRRCSASGRPCVRSTPCSFLNSVAM
jgi:hypothetical protein